MSTDRNLQSARGRGGNAWGERAGEEFALGHYLDNNRVIVGKASWVGLRWFMQRFTWVKNPARERERERGRDSPSPREAGVAQRGSRADGRGKVPDKLRESVVESTATKCYMGFLFRTVVGTGT